MMKKTMLIVLTLACAASVALAQSEVRSKNAVGYIQKFAPANKQICVGVPFVDMASTDGLVAFTNTDFYASASQGSIVYFWNDTSQTWSPVQRQAKGWEAGAAGKILRPGEAFFFKSADNKTYFMSGEVPAESDYEVALVGDANLSAVAYPYPVERAFTNSSLAARDSGSIVYFWDDATQLWNPVQKQSKGWEAGAGKVLAPGEGMFFKLPSGSSAPAPWKETKPYTWP